MKIVVCMKRVPDTTTQVRVNPDAKALDPTGVEYVINPYDEYGIEEALRIKEAKGGAPEVVVLTLGPAESEPVIRKTLAMGADRAILHKDTLPYRDSYSVAAALAAELKSLAPDLILFGKQAVDDDAAQVPSIVAALLGIPKAMVVSKLELMEGKVRAQRDIEGGKEIQELPLPCAIGATKGLNEPRLPSLKGIMAAKKKPLEVKDAVAVEPILEVLRMEPPPPRPAGRIVGKGVEAVPELVRLLREEAKVL